MRRATAGDRPDGAPWWSPGPLRPGVGGRYWESPIGCYRVFSSFARSCSAAALKFVPLTFRCLPDDPTDQEAAGYEEQSTRTQHQRNATRRGELVDAAGGVDAGGLGLFLLDVPLR